MASSPTYWPTGEPIVSREVWRGRVWTVRPMTLVRDDAGLIAYYMAPGTRYLHPRAPDGGPIPHFLPDDWRLVERTWVGGSALYLTRPGTAHVVMRMMDDTDSQVAFWYINLQQPIRRTRLGFDYLDHELDIVVEPDRTTWRWKDEDHLAASVARGLLDEAGARAIRAEGERVTAALGTSDTLVSEEWERWRPPADWSIPAIPPDWQTVTDTEMGSSMNLVSA